MLSLPRPDLSLPATASGAAEEPEREDPTVASQLATASWSFQLDPVEAQGVEVMDVTEEDEAFAVTAGGRSFPARLVKTKPLQHRLTSISFAAHSQSQMVESDRCFPLGDSNIQKRLQDLVLFRLNWDFQGDKLLCSRGIRPYLTG